jgi:acylpyruvate hydrolase
VTTTRRWPDSRGTPIKLATIRTDAGLRAVRIDEDVAVETGHPDVVDLLATSDWREITRRADGPRHSLADVDYAPVVSHPEKIICVGLNYRNHILEMGRELPAVPTLFAKYSRSLIGAYDDIVVPAASDALDWEAELGVVIGSPVRHASPAQAAAAIAGYTVVNDISARDWQYRTLQWLQGKTFEATTPVGPWLVTSDDGSAGGSMALSCHVDGDIVQTGDTADLVFDPVSLVAYISTLITLAPGDLIATGTPGGVGHARKPPRYLTDGSVVVTAIIGIGECRNTCRDEVIGRTG